jgi:hypothetical protein
MFKIKMEKLENVIIVINDICGSFLFNFYIMEFLELFHIIHFTIFAVNYSLIFLFSSNYYDILNI